MRVSTLASVTKVNGRGEVITHLLNRRLMLYCKASKNGLCPIIKDMCMAIYVSSSSISAVQLSVLTGKCFRYAWVFVESLKEVEVS